MAAAELRHIVFANRDGFEWALTGIVTAIAVATATIVGERVARWLAQEPGTDVACVPMTAAFGSSNSARASTATPAGRLNGALQAFWLVAAAIVNLLLVFDARYRDFPSLLFAPVVVAFAACAIARGRFVADVVREVEERMLVAALVVGAAVIVAMELPINLSADLWGLLCVAFAAATWINAARAPNDRVDDEPVSMRRS
jgi:hypothetical protein